MAGFTPAAISLTPSLHVARFMVSFFFKPMLLLSFSTCVFHIFFGSPRFLLPLTSNSNTFLRTCPSTLLNTCLYNLTPLAFAIWTAVSFNPNISIRFSVLFFSISFAPHIALLVLLTKLSKSFTVVIQPLSTCLIKPNFCFTLPPTQYRSFFRN